MLCMLLFISRCSYFVYEQRDATQVEDLLNRLAQENSSNQSGAHLTSCPEVACMEPIELLVLLNHALPVSRVCEYSRAF